ncbi:biosynthetic peptidoglycan transglycosylase, partial [Streptomyces sp. NPDC048551]
MGRAEARRAQQQRGARKAPGERAGKSTGKKRSGIRRFLNWKTILGTFLGGILLLVLGAVILYFSVDPPDPNKNATLQSNTYKYADGSIMARTGTMNREILPIEKIPEDVRTAFIAIENKSFYKDSGVDLIGVARGLFNTATGRGKAGGSTITQQYVKNYYLTQDQSATRKLRELV